MYASPARARSAGSDAPGPFSIAGSNVDSRIVDQTPCLPPDFACHQLDYGRQNFHKHVLSISLTYTR